MKTVAKILSLIFLMALNHAYAQLEPVGKDKVALGGYDVVAYFKAGKGVKGIPEINTVHNGVIYHFSTIENKNAFTKKPEGFLPQYDGYCALAIGAQNKKVTINPETFKITNGKLYMFYNGKFPLGRGTFNSIEPWIKDEDNLIKKADANWPTLKSSKRHTK